MAVAFGSCFGVQVHVGTDLPRIKNMPHLANSDISVVPLFTTHVWQVYINWLVVWNMFYLSIYLE